MAKVFGVTLVAQPGMVPEAFGFLEKLLGQRNLDDVAVFVVEGAGFDNETRLVNDLGIVISEPVLHVRINIGQFSRKIEKLASTIGVTMKELDDGSVLLRHRAFQGLFRLSW